MVMIVKFQDRAASFKSFLSILNYPEAKTTAEVFRVVHSCESLISKLPNYRRTSANGHPSTTANFFCPQGGRCIESFNCIANVHSVSILFQTFV